MWSLRSRARGKGIWSQLRHRSGSQWVVGPTRVAKKNRAVIARAHLHSMRASARKVRIILDLIRGKNVEEAFRILAFTNRGQAETLLKLLRSAVANAGLKGQYGPETLYVSTTYADGGFAFKKLEPKAMLRHGIQKRPTCHVTIEVDARPAAAGSATEARV